MHLPKKFCSKSSSPTLQVKNSVQRDKASRISNLFRSIIHTYYETLRKNCAKVCKLQDIDHTQITIITRKQNPLMIYFLKLSYKNTKTNHTFLFSDGMRQYRHVAESSRLLATWYTRAQVSRRFIIGSSTGRRRRRKAGAAIGNKRGGPTGFGIWSREAKGGHQEVRPQFQGRLAPRQTRLAHY